MLTSAYTQSSHHQINLDIVLKKDSAIRQPEDPFFKQAVVDQNIPRIMNANRTATREEIVRALELWKNVMIKSEEYIPYQQRLEDRHIEIIRVLKGAMSDYTRFNPAEAQSNGFQHSKFGPI